MNLKIAAFNLPYTRCYSGGKRGNSLGVIFLPPSTGESASGKGGA